MGKSKLKIPKICPQCGKPFEAKTVTTIFCSPNCNAKANKERKTKLLEEERAQAFLQEKAETIPKWKIGQISYVPKEQIDNIFNPKTKN